jgi:hypothetical protein
MKLLTMDRHRLGAAPQHTCTPSSLAVFFRSKARRVPLRLVLDLILVDGS